MVNQIASQSTIFIFRLVRGKISTEHTVRLVVILIFENSMRMTHAKKSVADVNYTMNTSGICFNLYLSGFFFALMGDLMTLARDHSRAPNSSQMPSRRKSCGPCNQLNSKFPTKLYKGKNLCNPPMSKALIGTLRDVIKSKTYKNLSAVASANFDALMEM